MVIESYGTDFDAIFEAAENLAYTGISIESCGKDMA
jgi:hypothetical protein